MMALVFILLLMVAAIFSAYKIPNNRVTYNKDEKE